MSAFRIDYGPDIEAAIGELERMVESTRTISEMYPSRWLAIALIDGDDGIDRQLEQTPGGDALLVKRDELLTLLDDALGEAVGTAIAGRRFDVVHDIASSASERSGGSLLTRSDRIDAVVTNKYLGIPIFLAAMWVVFKITTDVAGAFLDWVDSAIGGPIACGCQTARSRVSKVRAATSEPTTATTARARYPNVKPLERGTVSPRYQ